MIKVTIDLWPFGYEENKRTLSEFYIANDGMGNMIKGTYLFKRKLEDEWEQSVEHDRYDGVETLVKKVLEKHFD